MIISFCGHKNFSSTEELENKIQLLLEKLVGEKTVTFYLGGYGNFDAFACSCAKRYQQSHSEAILAFVTPYRNEEYQKTRVFKKEYDIVIFPPIENVPPKFAIFARNKWMVEQADIVIASVDHDWGGAYATYLHAKRKNKVIFNLAEDDDSRTNFL